MINGELETIHDNVLVTEMNFDEQVTAGGIIVGSDNGKTEGIKPRWGKVWAIGPTQTDVKVGEWILIEHGRWTRGVTVEDENGNQTIIRRVEVKSILASADDRPNDIMFGSHSSTEQGQVFRPEMFSGPQF